jgi:hypothetical protein
MSLQSIKNMPKISAPLDLKRDNAWLLSRLDSLWADHFSDVEKSNPVYIRFGKYSKYRLGSIKLSKQSKNTFITITKMFKQSNIPDEVVDQTIAHELVHYAHGFSSFRPRLHRYPHAGGIVNKELKRRGMDLVKAYKDWVKVYKKLLAD